MVSGNETCQLPIKKDPVDRNLLKQSFGGQNKEMDILNMIILFFKGNYAKVSARFTS